MKIIKLLFSLFLILLGHTAYSQTKTDSLKSGKDSIQVATAPTTVAPAKIRKDQRPIKDRIDLGFGTSFWITPNQTFVEIAPILAYRFPKTLVTGVGYRYIYRHSRIYGQDLNAYGPNFIARVNLLKRVYMWTEYEILHNEYLYQVVGQEVATQSVTTDSWFAGLGYMKSFRKSGRGGLSFQILYNFLYEREIYSPYYSAFTYRVGYFF